MEMRTARIIRVSNKRKEECASSPSSVQLFVKLQSLLTSDDNFKSTEVIAILKEEDSPSFIFPSGSVIMVHQELSLKRHFNDEKSDNQRGFMDGFIETKDRRSSESSLSLCQNTVNMSID